MDLKIPATLNNFIQLGAAIPEYTYERLSDAHVFQSPPGFLGIYNRIVTDDVNVVKGLQERYANSMYSVVTMTDKALPLEALGFYPGRLVWEMHLDLEHDFKGIAYNEKIATQIVKDKAGLDQWTQVVAKAYGMPEEAALRELRAYWKSASERFLFVMAMHEGKAVSACGAFLMGDTAAIYMAATLEEHRKQGLGSAVVHTLLSTLKERGIRKATLQVKEEGLHEAYKRYGCKDTLQYYQHMHPPGK